MGRTLDIRGEILPGVMALHVQTAFPQFTSAHVEYLALVGNIDRLSLLPVAFGQFPGINLFHSSAFSLEC